MENKRGTTVLLTVIGIATLLVAVVGATFAYFSITVTDDENNVDTNVTITAANLGTVTFTNGKTIDLCGATDGASDTCVIYPGATEGLDFTVKSTDADVDVDYNVYLNITENSFPVGIDTTNTNLEYRVWTDADTATTLDDAAIATSQDNAQWVKIPTGKTELTVAKAILTAQKTDTWYVEVRLAETGQPQNADQNQIFEAVLDVRTESTYTTTNTTTDEIGPYVNNAG